MPSLVQPIAGKPVKRWNFRKANRSYSPQRLREEHQVSQIHKLMTRTPHTHRIATCLYALRRRAPHADSTNTISPDGTTAATISCASTSRPPPRKTSTQRQQRYSISLMNDAWPFWRGIDLVVDPQLPREQAGFRRDRSTVGQVTLLTQDIEDNFQLNEKAGVEFSWTWQQKDLGILVCSNLMPRKHIEAVCSKVNRKTGMTKRCFMNTSHEQTRRQQNVGIF